MGKRAGIQLDSQTLYERQKQARAAGNQLPAPSIVAAGLTIAENMGMVLRLADDAGAPRVIFVTNDAPIPARIQKTARGADVYVPWEICDSRTFVQTFAPPLAPLIAVEITSESSDLFHTALPQPCTLVIGSEQHGIPAEILDVCDAAVHIPQYGVKGSMNVTHALAIALFEWRRQHPGG